MYYSKLNVMLLHAKMVLIALVISVPALGQSGFQRFEKRTEEELQVDNLSDDSTATSMVAKDSNGSKAQSCQHFLPVKNVEQSLKFFTGNSKNDDWALLERTSVFLNPRNQSASITSDLATDYFRWGRLSISIQLATAVAEGDDEDQAQAIQEMIGGGGNVVFAGDIPILSNNIDRKKDNAIVYRVDFAPNVGIDLPELGTFSETESTACNINPAFEVMAYNRGGMGNINLFGTLRIGPVIGNQQFYQNMGRELGRGFLYGHLTAGVDLNNHVRLSWNYFFGSSFVRSNFNNTFSSSVLP